VQFHSYSTNGKPVFISTYIKSFLNSGAFLTSLFNHRLQRLKAASRSSRSRPAVRHDQEEPPCPVPGPEPEPVRDGGVAGDDPEPGDLLFKSSASWWMIARIACANMTRVNVTGIYYIIAISKTAPARSWSVDNTTRPCDRDRVHECFGREPHVMGQAPLPLPDFSGIT